METQVLMKRELFGCEISQQSKTEFFSATDLVKAGNKWRIANELTPFDMQAWFKTKQASEFEKELLDKYGVVKKAARGRGSHTWVHPLLFIDMALAISPKLKVEVYEWLFDHLLKHRNESGDSYKEMTGALYTRFSNNKQFPKFIIEVADYIKSSCGVSDWNKATEDQLKTRDKIHLSIKTLCVVIDNPRQAVRIGVLENTKPKDPKPKQSTYNPEF